MPVMIEDTPRFESFKADLKALCRKHHIRLEIDPSEEPVSLEVWEEGLPRNAPILMNYLTTPQLP